MIIKINQCKLYFKINFILIFMIYINIKLPSTHAHPELPLTLIPTDNPLEIAY